MEGESSEFKGMQMRQLGQKLIQSARANPPADTVPYAFEQRIMANLRALNPVDAWETWSAGLWRAALACLAITILSGAWSIWGQRDAAVSDEFAQEFETAVVMSESHYELW